MRSGQQVALAHDLKELIDLLHLQQPALRFAANGVASSAGSTVTVRKSDRVFRKLNGLARFSVPLLLGTQY